MPAVYLVHTPSNFRQSQSALFGVSEIDVAYRVEYCGDDDPVPGNLFGVIEDIRDAGIHLYIGRPLKTFPSGISSPYYYAKAYDAAATLAEINSGTTPFMVRHYEGNLVPGSRNVWEVRVSLSLLCNGTLYDQLHSTVITTTSSRTSSAYRVGPEINFIADETSSPKLGTPEMGNVLGQCIAGSATTGTYDPDEWRTASKATMDIAGSPIDLNGQPISMRIEQINHTLSFVIRRPYLGDLPGFPTPSGYGSRTKMCLWQLWGEYSEWPLNKRNATEMFGYRPGSLVCTAVDLQEIDAEYMRCNVTLSWDEWDHCEQVPWTILGTLPPLVPEGSGDRVIINADTVFWANPYQEAFDWTADAFPDGSYSLFSDMIDGSPS